MNKKTDANPEIFQERKTTEEEIQFINKQTK